MKDIKYYRTTTNNAQVLRLIDGVMQVFDIEKKWVNSMDWFNKSFLMTLRILKKFQKMMHLLILTGW
ncbi:hypothetical protein HKM25_1580 [Streptococcus pneumoniae]|uniref:hypothetical protein n=1 Tax=Streptococcus pneumoniae TaxID=1313 RepID=UPI00159A6C7A|nr:hypothetical protein [Streptococcus pneumoniae]QJS37286.1 hypothetical protein HKM25_1580 [Streptococcus pneumoniae]